MSRETREFKILVFKCDIPTCDVEIIVKEEVTETENPLFGIAINDDEWDFCHACYERTLLILDFLNTCVGIPFKFKVVKR